MHLCETLSHTYYIPLQSRKPGQILNTFVVSASVTNASSPIKDLPEDVQVTLHHFKPNKVRESIFNQVLPTLINILTK